MIRRLREHSAALVLAAVTALGTTTAVVPTAATSGASGHPPIVRIRQGTSTNWSGYAAFGGSNAFTSVTASWVQPAVDCSSGATTYSSFWVGLDGYNTSTVEQLGTEADCSGGHARYSSWWETYPRPSYSAPVTVTPGHRYTASVTAGSKGTFTLKLVDNTTPQTFTTTQKASSAKRASAEVVAEAPWSGSVLPLANFGTVSFTGATANGPTTGIGTFPNVDPITMLNPAGMKATPTGFTDAAKQSFSINWSAS